MIKNKIMFVILFSFFLSLVIPVSAQGQRWTTPSYNYIDLTEDQLDKIQELQLAFQKDILSLRTELVTGYMELDNLYVQNTDQKKIEIKLNELDRMESELDKIFAAHQQQIRNLLTDNQKALFDRFGGLGMGLGWSSGLGMGMRYGWAGGMGMRAGRFGGLGMRYGRAGGIGMRADRFGGLGMRYSRGMGFNSRFGRNWGRGMDRAAGWNRSLGYNRSFDRNWERGLGRGYRCPFFRLRRFR